MILLAKMGHFLKHASVALKYAISVVNIRYLANCSNTLVANTVPNITKISQLFVEIWSSE